jgi:hypothetical protein
MAHYSWKAGRDNLHGKQRLRTSALGSAPSRETRPSPLRAAARLRCRPQSGYRAIEGAVACRSDGRGQFVMLTPEGLKALDVESPKVIVASCPQSIRVALRHKQGEPTEPAHWECRVALLHSRRFGFSGRHWDIPAPRPR